MTDQKQSWIKTNAKYFFVGIGLFLVLIAFGAFKGNNYVNLLKDEIKRNDSIAKVHKRNADSLETVANDRLVIADGLRYENDELRTNNNNLYYELNRQKKLSRVPDTSFINNSKRIADSNDKYYQRDDAPGQGGDDSNW